jgi:hypothetical protein
MDNEDIQDATYKLAFLVAQEAMRRNNGKVVSVKSIHRLTTMEGVHDAKIIVELTRDLVQTVKDELRLELTEQEDNPAH